MSTRRIICFALIISVFMSMFPAYAEENTRYESINDFALLQDNQVQEKSKVIPEITEDASVGESISLMNVAEDFYWELSQDGTLTISGNGYMPNYGSEEVPWRYERDKIVSVVIEPGITSVGYCAFYMCDMLENVSLPDTIELVYGYAFYGCTSLKSVKIPDSVTELGRYVFGYCYALESIELSDNIDICGDSCFYMCEKLKNINFPQKLEYVNGYMFYYCSSLESISLPDNLHLIGTNAFYSCSSLKSIELPNPENISFTIWDNAFAWCSALESINIPNNLYEIKEFAFMGCSSLVEIQLSEKISKIGTYAFAYCESLENVYIPQSITEITNDAFFGCTKLTAINVSDGNNNYSSLDGVLFNKTKTELLQYPSAKNEVAYTMPESVTTIIGNAFYYCSHLKSIDISGGVTNLEASTFVGCGELAQINIPASVSEISADAVYQCMKFETFNVDENNKNYCSKDGVLFNKDRSCLITYPIGKVDTQYIIPNGVVEIADNAFYCNTVLQQITISEGVEKIGIYAFMLCEKLSTLELPKSLTDIGDYAFYGCSTDMTVKYAGTQSQWDSLVITEGNEVLSQADTEFNVQLTKPEVEVTSNGSCGANLTWYLDAEGTLVISGTGDMENYTEYSTTVAPWKEYRSDIKLVIIENGITSIGEYAFVDCKSLENIYIPNSVTNIGQYAFSWCTSLKSVDVPDKVKTIREYTFNYCTSLTNVYIPYGVTTIADFAFCDCRSLTQVDIPDSVTYLSGFCGCESLTEIEIPNSVTTIGESAFSGCENIAYFDLPDNLTSIGDWAFNECTMQYINIPQGVTEIGFRAFYECGNLTKINIPYGVTFIENYTFEDCCSLVDVSIPGSVIGIGNSAFEGCSSLSNITIPNSVTAIGQRAFYNCCSLVEVDIPDSVTTIYDGAFSCTSLIRVNIPNSITVINEDTFSACSSLVYVEIPDSVTSIGDSAFASCSSLTHIDIPNSVTTIGDRAFAGCSSLGSVVIPDNVTSLGSYAFGNSGLKSVIIGNGLTEIPQNVFCDYLHDACWLETIYIPKTIKKIDVNGLGNKRASRKEPLIVNYEGTQQEWEQIQIVYTNNEYGIPIDANTILQESNCIIYTEQPPIFEPIDYDISTINNSIIINYNGYGYARFRLTDSDGFPVSGRTIDYSFDGYGDSASGTATTDGFGVLTVKTPVLTSSKNTTETTTLKVLLDGFGEYDVNVKITPLSYSQEWKGLLSVGAEVSAGLQLGATAGPLELEAKLASIGLGGNLAKGLSVKETYADGRRNLTLKTTYNMEAGVNADAGLTVGGKIPQETKTNLTKTAVNNLGFELTAGKVAGDFGVGATGEKALSIDNYDPKNTTQLNKLALFLFDSTYIGGGINAFANGIRAIANQEIVEYHNEEYINATATVGVSAEAGKAGIGKNSVVAVGLSESAVFNVGMGYNKNGKTILSNKVSDKSGINIGKVKIGKQDKLDNENKLSLSGEVYRHWSNDFLNNNIQITAVKDNDSLEILSVKSVEGNNDYGWGADMMTETIDRKIEFKGEHANNVVYLAPSLASFVAGNKVFLTTEQLSDVVDTALTSGYHADYTRVYNKEEEFQLPFNIGIKALVGADINFSLYGNHEIEYDFENGLMGNGNLYKTSDSYPGEKILSQRKTLGEVLAEPLDTIVKIVKDSIEEITGEIKSGINYGKAKVVGAAEIVYCKITGIKSGSSVLQSYPILCVDDDISLLSTAAVASTVGEPYIISLLDSSYSELTNWDDKVTLILSYDEQDLAAAGISNTQAELDKLKIYRWSDEKQVYVCVGGNHDYGNSCVSADITMPGQYILATDNCAPIITDFKVYYKSGVPEFSAVISDMSGIADFEFKIDGNLVVDESTMDKFYSISNSQFTYTLENNLSSGKHTATLFAVDTAGNEMTDYQILEFTIDNENPVFQSISVPEVARDGQITVSAEIADSGIDAVTAHVKYNGCVYNYNMTSNQGVYSKTITGLPESEFVEIYITAVDANTNSSQSNTYKVYCKPQGDVYAAIMDCGDGEVNVIVGNDGEALSGILCVVGYQNSEIAQVQYTNHNFNSKYESLSFKMQDSLEYYKVFCWDGNNLKPLCRAYTNQ